jgi:hypothetical protein
MLDFRELMMGKTHIVGASDQVHACLKRSQTMSGMTRFARQAGQTFSEGSIQALDKSGVEDAATMRAQEQPLRLLQASMGHLAGDLNHAFFLRSLDNRPNVQVWPDTQTGSPDSPRLLDLLPESAADTARISAPSICQDEQGAQASCTSANLVHQGISQMAITRALDHPTQPQARRNHHRQAHPGDHLTAFHPNFIGLNVHQVQLTLFDDRLMHLGTMRSCSITPIGYSPLIQAKGMDNGLDRASIREQRYDDDDQFHGFAQSLKHRSPTGTERLFTHPTTIALALAIMDRDRARTSLASCRTRRIRAKCSRRVHWLWCTVLHKHILPAAVTFFNSPPLHRIVGSYPYR